MEETTSPAANSPTTRSRSRLLSGPQRIIRIALIAAVLAALVFVVLRITTQATPEDRLRKIADDYFTDKIKTATKRSTSYTLVLKNLRQIGYDVSFFEKNECSLDSYAVVHLHNPTEIQAEKITYDVEVHLTGCE